jgi:outer membrane receptor for ferrienterochelin and colicin
VEEEVAINYELGARFQDGSLSAELIAFVSNYDNLLGPMHCVFGQRLRDR